MTRYAFAGFPPPPPRPRFDEYDADQLRWRPSLTDPRPGALTLDLTKQSHRLFVAASGACFGSRCRLGDLEDAAQVLYDAGRENDVEISAQAIYALWTLVRRIEERACVQVIVPVCAESSPARLGRALHWAVEHEVVTPALFGFLCAG